MVQIISQSDIEPNVLRDTYRIGIFCNVTPLENLQYLAVVRYSFHQQLQVTMTTRPTTLKAAKEQQWAQQEHAHLSTYNTASRTPTMMTALSYVGQVGNTKRGLIKHEAGADGGQAAQVGRKATGEFVAEADKSYHKLDFRHPVPYTVKLRTLSEALSADCGSAPVGQAA